MPADKLYLKLQSGITDLHLLLKGMENSIAPVYLNSDGVTCANPYVNTRTFKSVSYLLRSNANSSQDPGSIKFVIKIEKNPLKTSNTGTMKPQYMSVDIGESWKDPTTGIGHCPTGTIKMGYLSGGNPLCINPALPCTASDEVAVGVNSAGNTLCEKFPSCDDPTDGYSLTADKKLMCSDPYPECGANKVFLGYFAGNGDPICTGLSMKSASNQVQVGVSQSGGSVIAACSSVPPCTETGKKLIFNGTAFECSNASTSTIACANNQVMIGVNASK